MISGITQALMVFNWGVPVLPVRSLLVDMTLSVLCAQTVCMWIPTPAAEVVERIVQPRASGCRVHGADADSSLSCHVSSERPFKPGY